MVRVVIWVLKADLFIFLKDIGYNIENSGYHNDMYIAKYNLI